MSHQYLEYTSHTGFKYRILNPLDHAHHIDFRRVIKNRERQIRVALEPRQKVFHQMGTHITSDLCSEDPSLSADQLVIEVKLCNKFQHL